MNATVLPADLGGRSWLHRVLDLLDRGITGLLLLSVGSMVAVVVAQVVLRYGFNRSIDWADEVSRLAFVVSIFLAVPLGVRQGAHIGIDLLVHRLPVGAQRLLRRAAAAVSAALMAAVAWAAAGVAAEQWDELMSTLDWSVGWFIVPVGVGAAVSALHLLRIVIEGPPAARPEGAE